METGYRYLDILGNKLEVNDAVIWLNKNFVNGAALSSGTVLELKGGRVKVFWADETFSVRSKDVYKASASQDQPPLNPNGTPQTSRWFDQVKAFTEAMGQPVGEDINDKDEDIQGLLYMREELINEEFFETKAEIRRPLRTPFDETGIDKMALTKELADLLYVTIGFAVAFGLPLCEVFERVHQSNMSKLGEDGKPIYREDGKVMKGPNYQPPQLDDLF